MARLGPPLSPCRGGAGFKLLVFLVIIGAAASLAWMLLLPLVFTSQVRQRTGFDATVQSLAVNPFTGTVELRGLVLSNPPTFPASDCVELRRFSAEAEMFTLLSDRPVLSSVVLEVAKVTLVRREALQTNFGALQQRLAAPDDPARPPSSSPPGPARRFLIRRLTVQLDEFVLADHSRRVPAVQAHKLGFQQTYTDVTDVKQLLAPVVLQGLLPSGAGLKGLLPGGLGQTLGEALKQATSSGTGVLKGAGQRAGEKIKGYFDALEESKKP